jgi:tetratricopeptide (TPR) repeat protein
MASIDELQEEYYNKEFFDAEEKKTLQALVDHPERATAHHKYLGFIYDVMHRHEDCVYHAEKAIELSNSITEKADTRVLIARSHIYRKEINLAIAQYLIAHDEDPSHEVIIEEVAHCYKQLKDYDNAEKWYTLLTTLEDCEAMGYSYLGDFYAEKKEYETAIEKYAKALTFDAEDQSAIHGLGVIYAEIDKYDEALNYFNQEKKLYPESPMPDYAIGLCYQKQEDFYRALHHYTEALKIAPGFPEVYNNMAVIHLEMDGDIRAALTDLEKAAELATDTKQRTLFYMNLSRLYDKIKDEEKHLFWKKKFMDEMGFKGLISWEDDEEDDDGDILK